MNEETQQYNMGTDRWEKASPIPYYPSLIEKILHFFGIHQWTYVEPRECVICGKSNLPASRSGESE